LLKLDNGKVKHFYIIYNIDNTIKYLQINFKLLVYSWFTVVYIGNALAINK